ncbi:MULTISPECIES: hypothetical protein [Streptomyces]|nr:MULTISPECIES: hypothetical protein [Streptomyces]
MARDLPFPHADFGEEYAAQGESLAMNYRVTVSDFETGADRILTMGPLTTPALLLDRWALDSSHRSRGGAIRTLDTFQLELRKVVRQAVHHFEARARTCPPKGPPLDPPTAAQAGTRRLSATSARLRVRHEG